MSIIKIKQLPAIFILSTLSGISLTANATENGSPTTAMGLYGFGAGILPPATDLGTFGIRFSDYDSSRLMGSDGNEESNKTFSLNVKAVTLAYIRMTNKTILGGQYGFGIAAPFFEMKSDLEIFAGGHSVLHNNADVFSPADILLQPLMLQWNPSENLSINGQFQILAPTGDYDKDRLVSPGLNHWAFSPIVSLTYITDAGFEMSSTSELDVSTKNNATEYKNGIEYRNEFAVGQHVGNWTLGVGGYYYKQLTDDSGPNSGDGKRVQALALGPSIQFFGKNLPPVWIHAYKEFDVRNRPEGYNISVRMAASF